MNYAEKKSASFQSFVKQVQKRWMLFEVFEVISVMIQLFMRASEYLSMGKAFKILLKWNANDFPQRRERLENSFLVSSFCFYDEKYYKFCVHLSLSYFPFFNFPFLSSLSFYISSLSALFLQSSLPANCSYSFVSVSPQFVSTLWF